MTWLKVAMRGRMAQFLISMVVSAVFLVLAVTVIPVVLAQRLTRESGILRTE